MNTDSWCELCGKPRLCSSGRSMMFLILIAMFMCDDVPVACFILTFLLPREGMNGNEYVSCGINTHLTNVCMTGNEGR